MVKSLVDLCISAVCQYHLQDDLALMPTECKQRLLEFFASHDQLSLSDCDRLVCLPSFGSNLTHLTFYLCHDLTDVILTALTSANNRIEKMTLVECIRVSDSGIQAATKNQPYMVQMELRAMCITDNAFETMQCPKLRSVDLSGCRRITSNGVRSIVSRHPYLCNLYLNHCLSLDDQALYYIAEFCNEKLTILELDFPAPLTDPAAALLHLTRSCPNISQLSVARFFNELEQVDPTTPPYQIDGVSLKNVDLYANYFLTLPTLPPSVETLRLSISGEENCEDFVRSLLMQRELKSINLQLTVRDGSIQAVDNANALLQAIIPFLGDKITILQISVPRLFDEALTLIMNQTPNLVHLALDVGHLNTFLLQKYFAPMAAGRKLKSLKICRLRITYRILFAIARGAKNLTDLETSHMLSIDDRFISLLAQNCRQLKAVNFNGCRYVSDLGLAALARRCPLREVRIRGTACTDKCVYILAQFCPDLEWISYADYSGRPKFTDVALQCLRDSCIQRVIC